MHYAFVDESGTDSPFSGSHFLVVALVATAQVRNIELPVRRAHKRYGTSLTSGEMKASASRETVVEYLLRAVAGASIEIVVVALDKRGIKRPPEDPMALYIAVAARAVRHAVCRWPRLAVCFDRRYTAKRMRTQVEQQIRENIVDMHQEVVLLQQEDSISCKALQAADCVAWAFFQKYERGDARFCDLVGDRIVVQEVIERALW